MKTQAKKTKKPKMVKLRVTRKKFMVQVIGSGKTRIVPGPWGHKVMYNGRTYSPGEEFKALPIHADRLLAGGTVQKAEDECTPYRPPNLDHNITLTNGIKLRDQVEGLVPTRTGVADSESPWVEAETF